MNNFYKFLLNSYYFNDLLNQTKIKIDFLINMYKSINPEFYKDDNKTKEILFDLYKITPFYDIKHSDNPNILKFFKSLYSNGITKNYITVFNNLENKEKDNIFILVCPFEFIDKVYKNQKNEFIEFLYHYCLNPVKFHYFILKFDNYPKSQNKFNNLKKLISKLKIKDKYYVLSSVLYESGDCLKIEYHNIYDKTDEEYEIRQSKFYLNNCLLSSNEILDNYESHIGDIEYIKEDNYFHRFKYCIYEEYNDNFIPTDEFKEVDEKYKSLITS